jgi:hypothetical protein
MSFGNGVPSPPRREDDTSVAVDSRWMRASGDRGDDASDGRRWIVAVSSWVYLGDVGHVVDDALL